MSQLSFLRASAPLSLAVVAAEIGARLAPDADPARMICAVAPLDRAGRDDASAFLDGQTIDDLMETRAGACLIAPRHLAHLPRTTAALVTDRPRDALCLLAARLHPSSRRPGAILGGTGIDPSARVAATARLEAGVTIEAGTIIGPDAEIGAGSFVGAACVIGQGVRIGRGCAIDAGVVVSYALVGDRVIIHAGACLGHVDCDASATHRDPSLGRVIVQDDVEVGANAAIARGHFADTIVGEGARIAASASIGADEMVDRAKRVGRM